MNFLTDLNILVTNDDNHESPLLHFLINYLSPKNNLTVVVPLHERSWTGKSITVSSEITVQQTKLFETEAYYVSGNPADCVNIGLYHLAKNKIDLVISGINAGLNAGSSFAISSGTIGACLEGNIAGISGIALSQALSQPDFDYWKSNRKFTESSERHLIGQLEIQMGLVEDFLAQDQKFLEQKITWNINFPDEWKFRERIYQAELNHGYYKSVFKGGPSNFFHSVAKSEVQVADTPNSDFVLLEHGHITATKLNYRNLGQAT